MSRRSLENEDWSSEDFNDDEMESDESNENCEMPLLMPLTTTQEPVVNHSATRTFVSNSTNENDGPTIATVTLQLIPESNENGNQSNELANNPLSLNQWLNISDRLFDGIIERMLADPNTMTSLQSMEEHLATLFQRIPTSGGADSNNSQRAIVEDGSDSESNDEAEIVVGSEGIVNFLNRASTAHIMGSNNGNNAINANNSPGTRLFRNFMSQLASPISQPLVVNNCTHHLLCKYDHVHDMPIGTCPTCQEVVIVPDQHDRSKACIIKQPESLRRDPRFKELFQIHQEFIETRFLLQKCLEKSNHLRVKLCDWERRYTTTNISDSIRKSKTNHYFLGQGNPCFNELKMALQKHTNQLEAFSTVSNEGFESYFDDMIVAIKNTFPVNKRAFCRSMKHQIIARQPQPILLPGLKELPNCSVCDKKVSIRLHSSTFDSSKRNCTCEEFSLCLGCLLSWYYENTEQLQKSFCTCPTCKAEFYLQDIIRVCVQSK